MDEKFPKTVFVTRDHDPNDPEDTWLAAHESVGDTAQYGEATVVGVYEYVGLTTVTLEVKATDTK